MKIYSEITPLNSDDIFVILDHRNAKFDYPVHMHPEYELNLVLNSAGNRIVGDSVAKYGEADLVLIGPNTYHCWEKDDDSKEDTHVVTIQFEQNFINNDLLAKNSLKHIKHLLEHSVRGIEFFGKTRAMASERIQKLPGLSGFESAIEFLTILNLLASSKEQKNLTSVGFSSKPEHSISTRINEVYYHVLENYNDVDLNLSSVARKVNMSDSAFSHFFKKRTNKSFTQFVIDLRIGQASKLLLETSDSIGQICYSCGFNNVSNFNRLFKKNRGSTPRNYRNQFQDHSITSEQVPEIKEEYLRVV
ncbi:helix-turn-helix domain-containing protein [Fulvivirga sp. M361]|uniref:AraC family transcriptional regulator n=1 Tax=Fulvivirga sp. M361 TaxID=2594266 RepID=UPI00117AEEBD|nr:AraC family transcriptional regulator [Fulvivirga sp. M361]TRX59953.1 helix-turn-helix domain-containing protein [Fulvivirga sp. M361]